MKSGSAYFPYHFHPFFYLEPASAAAAYPPILFTELHLHNLIIPVIRPEQFCSCRLHENKSLQEEKNGFYKRKISSSGKRLL